MGVNSLWEIIGPTARPVRLEALSRKKLAVDASIWIYQFLKAVRDQDGNSLPQSHIVGFFRRICKLLYYGILPIFVFDGGAPILKRETINRRKSRRSGNAETKRQTAHKLLAIQSLRHGDEKKINVRSSEATGQYYEDTLNHTTSSTTKNFLKKDDFHLPDIKEFKVSSGDGRVIPEDEQFVYEDFDVVDGIDINTCDTKSPEFQELPKSTQYMILSHLRIKSRLRLGYQKEQLQELFPNPNDFSKFQIQLVQKRNYYTQKLMDLSGMNNDGTTTSRRIASDKDRAYALMKNDDGWTLTLSSNSEENPITFDENGDEIKQEKKKEVPKQVQVQTQKIVKVESDDDSDFEDVPLIESKPSQQEIEHKRKIIDSLYREFEMKEEPEIKTEERLIVGNFNDVKHINKVSVNQISDDFSFTNSMLFNGGGKSKDPSTNVSQNWGPIETTNGISILDKSGSVNNVNEPININVDTPVHETTNEIHDDNERMHETNKIIENTVDRVDNVEAVFEVDEKPHEMFEVESDGAHRENLHQSDPIIKSPILKESIDLESEPVIEKKKPLNLMPLWFDDSIQQTQFTQPEPVPFHGDQDSEEDTGLIPWGEARDMLEDEDANYTSNQDDIQEISENQMTADKQTDIQKEITTSDPNLSTNGETRTAKYIDYDFEEEEEEELVKKLEVEEEDHEKFTNQIKENYDDVLARINESINEEQLLQEKLLKAKRDSDEVDQNMIQDVQELLRRFGIPYITAPMEAEAQCAELKKLGLVDGIITDDSDCFLFGGDKIYKNMFNQKQYVECYNSKEIEIQLGLNQDRLIDLALLLGSDYTEGVKGIGPVLGVEILAEFGDLNKFKQWYNDEILHSNKDADYTKLQKTLLNRIKTGKLSLTESFPEKVVADAYIHPEVDSDDSVFKWGMPSLDEIRSFLMYNVKWTQERVDEVMVPLIRDMNKKKAEGSQSTIGEFFPQEYIKTKKDLNLGKRLKTATSKLNKRRRKS